MARNKITDEKLVMQYFREKRADFPKGKLTKSESPDFTLKISSKRSNRIFNFVDTVVFAVGHAGLSADHGRRSLGKQQHGQLGLPDYQLCILGWYRTCWYINLCCTFTLPSKMENGN